MFETSSSAVLTIETARALQRRNRVDLLLRPVAPFADGLAAFARHAPALVPLLSRQPGRADLWLSTGWPPRPSRPDTKHFCVRVDWEYGALPAELSPLVTQVHGADTIIVHSHVVRRTLTAAGCDLDRVELIPPRRGWRGVLRTRAAPAVGVGLQGRSCGAAVRGRAHLA